jgi:shikimate kinase
MGPVGPVVALVGFMGAGKSDVGLELAASLGVPVVDSDELIVEAAGPIPRIFAERGEGGFRALEAEVVTVAIADAAAHPCVLSLGGGAVLSESVREALRRLPHVAWLTAPPGILWERVAAAGEAERPLAGDEAAFAALLAAREPLYQEVATMVVDTSVGSPAAIAAGLAAKLVGGDRASTAHVEDDRR